MSRTELLQRAIHSAKCRIYRINYDLNCDISLNHQRKAENQKELMDITVEALEKQIPKKSMTQFDRIKAMSIDEMAEYFLTKSFDPCDITNFPVVDCDAGCDKCLRKWLESEVEAE